MASSIPGRQPGVRSADLADGGDLVRGHAFALASVVRGALARDQPEERGDDDLIDLDDPLQPVASGANHCPAQLVQQIPRRAIAPQPQHPLQAQGASQRGSK
jgi:hypothetical protein